MPVLQGLLHRLPHRCRHGHLQGRGAAPAVPRQAAAAQPLRARPAAPVGPADPAGGAAGQPRAAVTGRAARVPVGGRHRPAAQHPRLRVALVPHAGGGADPPAGSRRRDLGRLVHRPLRLGAGDGRGRPARVRRPPGGRGAGAGVLRADLGQHGPARPGAPDRRPHRRGAARVRRPRDPGGRARAVLPRGAALRRRRAHRRPPGGRGGPRCAHAGRAARDRGGVAATGPHRHARGGAAALPPHVGARLRGRRPAAGPHRRHRRPGSAAAAGWPATSASRRGTTTSRSRSPSTPCCRRCGRRGRTRSSWPTGSPAARSWPTWPTYARFTCPSCCSPRGTAPAGRGAEPGSPRACGRRWTGATRRP